MRIVFLIQDDPLYILPLFQKMFAQRVPGVEYRAIFACRSMGSRKRSKLIRELLQLYGTFGFAKLAALQLWTRLADRLGLGAINGVAYSIRSLARRKQIPYYPVGNPNGQTVFQAIAAEQPDLIISVACPFILKKPLLELPTRAAINIHHAPLPRYKGMMPTFWQMFHREKSVGITIHTMAEKIDEGSILYQAAMPINSGETMHELIRRSKATGGMALLEVVKKFARGEELTPLLVSSASTYFTFPTAEEMRVFRQQGFRAI